MILNRVKIIKIEFIKPDWREVRPIWFDIWKTKLNHQYINLNDIKEKQLKLTAIWYIYRYVTCWRSSSKETSDFEGHKITLLIEPHPSVTKFDEKGISKLWFIEEKKAVKVNGMYGKSSSVTKRGRLLKLKKKPCKALTSEPNRAGKLFTTIGIDDVMRQLKSVI